MLKIDQLILTQWYTVDTQGCTEGSLIIENAVVIRIELVDENFFVIMQIENRRTGGDTVVHGVHTVVHSVNSLVIENAMAIQPELS